ncbi:tripartite tricarboxylate transporter TctB family protein [Robertmurraya massiliosenegalensis]|uniref:tripartite tricarboxylate transporter TctB family protein n=1 Tax=Robertmurraya massiliosenegalensis TaxID=1287657 RepID=UPI000318EA0C|nr:tripartite tricarboxylate transporter TctB family protein [Robertmurraya massiliosenegalensis]
MLKTINQRIALILFLLAAGYLIVSYQLPSFPYTPVDADVIPKGLGWLLIVLSVALYFSKDSETEEQKSRRNIPKKELLMISAVFLMVFGYIALFEIMGFIVMTVLFIYFCTWFLGYKKHVINVIVSICFSLFMYAIFVYLLGIKLPQGIIPI